MRNRNRATPKSPSDSGRLIRAAEYQPCHSNAPLLEAPRRSVTQAGFIRHDRWHHIEALYHAALQRPPSERDVFLSAACEGDVELQAAIESLLRQQSGSAVDGLTWEHVPSAIEDRALAPGAQFGPYKVIRAIGSGGMGEVYRAKDIRLDRDVAIKVLPEHLAKDSQARARFEREAKVVAVLNHPNICALYDVGPDYLVMELVEGPTLAERIAHGAIPLEEALAIAHQITDGLEAAHEKGIVHRDLKPANIKVSPRGGVKILDFGLATASQVAVPVVDNPEDTPTHTVTLSGPGLILGTPAYMAPEQARGRIVDKRADIWAFGVVLYEMLTGGRLFEGETTAEILAAVLTKEPEWERLPAPAQKLVRSCLEKNPHRRLRDIGDFWRPIEEAPRIEDVRRGGLHWALTALLLLISSMLRFVRC